MTTREANDNDPVGTAGAFDPAAPVPSDRPGWEPARPPLPKRFYVSANVVARTDGGYGISLDGRCVQTPKKSALVLPTRALAEAIAAEWQAQTDRIDPASMPLTRLANTTLDAVVANVAAVRADISAFASTDALLYRAEEPQALVEQQALAWDPILAWAEADLQARFMATRGIIHVAQPEHSLSAIARLADQMSAWQIAPLHVMTTLTGSALLALAVERERLDATQAWAIAHVDEDFQISRWGPDFEAADRRALRWLEMQSAARFLLLASLSEPPEEGN
jgi:chaperone required for assembly of F1-ATPase